MIFDSLNKIIIHRQHAHSTVLKSSLTKNNKAIRLKISFLNLQLQLSVNKKLQRK